MIRSTGYDLVTGQALSRSSTGSTRPAVIPTHLTPDQIQDIFEAQSGFPFRADVICRFTPPSDQAIDLQRRVLQELNRIFTKHGKKAKNFEQAVLNDFVAYLKTQHEIEPDAAQCWNCQLKAAFTAANNAILRNRTSTTILTTMSSVATSSKAQRIDKEFRTRIDKEFRTRIGRYISDKDLIEILSNELCAILEKKKDVRFFEVDVQHAFEDFVMLQPNIEDGDMVYVTAELKNAMKAANQKERGEETMRPTLAVALPVPVSSSSLVSQTNSSVMQRIQAVFTKVWSLILSFFANLVKRIQE